MSAPERRRPVRLLAAAAAAGAGAGLIAWLVLSAGGASVRPWLVIALAVTACLLAAAVAALMQWRGPEPADRFGGAAQLAPPVRTDRDRGGVERIERRVVRSMEDPGRFDDVLRRWLAELAEHRLRRRHGVDSRTDPDLAHHLLGDSLWQMLTTPTRTAPSKQDLEAWVQRIESL